jgi:endonuclease YncB( thermonuclease family)
MNLLTTRLALLLAVLTAGHTLCVQDARSAPPPYGLTAHGKIVNVVDGDTIDVEVRYVVRVRLRDCWVPDDDEPVNEQAEEDLAAYAGGKPVVLHIPTHKARGFADLLTLNRVLGEVWKVGDDESLSQWQVRLGNASTKKNGVLGK